ncbi:MAG: carboxypeptidase-like regulatory domain-containing protein, partial [Nannocystaceae bacterium]|nr:carboxypeptidase-like regulatory domain-containing protein [Nannocystaceae bacterium]
SSAASDVYKRQVDADGSPVADAVVRASLPSLSVERTLTDDNGDFEIGGLPVGEALRLRVTDASPGGAFVDQEARVGDKARVDMPRGSTLTVTPSGIGVGRLSLSGPRTAQHSLREDETARFVRLPEGKYRLEARGEDGYAVKTFELGGSDMALSLAGDAWAVVEGTLAPELIEHGGWVVLAADATGQVGGHELQRALLGHATRTASDGTFTISRVAPGPGEITLTPPEGATTKAVTVSIDPSPGERLDLGEVGAPASPT